MAPRPSSPKLLLLSSRATMNAMVELLLPRRRPSGNEVSMKKRLETQAAVSFFGFLGTGLCFGGEHLCCGGRKCEGQWKQRISTAHLPLKDHSKGCVWFRSRACGKDRHFVAAAAAEARWIQGGVGLAFQKYFIIFSPPVKNAHVMRSAVFGTSQRAFTGSCFRLVFFGVHAC